MRKLTLALVVAALLAASTLFSCAAPSDTAKHPGSTVSAETPATPSVEAEPSKMSAELAAKLVPNNARAINDPAVPEATLVLFTDYQCPYCAHMDTVVQQAKNDYRDQLRIVVRNFPLSMHENSKAAAQAVEAGV